jgi:hypothetical protein
MVDLTLASLIPTVKTWLEEEGIPLGSGGKAEGEQDDEDG